MQLPIYSLNNLLVDSKGLRRLTIKSFDIHRGAIYVVSGKPGSGKTTMLNVLANKIKIKNNSVAYEGKNLYQVSNKDFNEDVTYVSQINKPTWFSAEHYMKKIISKSSHRSNNVEKHINKISKQLNCQHLLNRNMRMLTPGQLRWIILASAIATDSKVLIIDEIEQHLSSDMIKLLCKVLHRKSNHDGVSIILSTLNPEFVFSISSVIINLSDGRITSVRSSNRRKNNK